MLESLIVSDLSGYEKLRLWWGFFWRSICITIASTLGGGLAGFIFGFLGSFLFAALKIPRVEVETIVTVGSGMLGFLVGAALFYVYIRWLLSGSIGGFRLLLVRSESVT